MKYKRFAIIDPVGIKAGLDFYDQSLATAFSERSCYVMVYSNFDSSNTSVINCFPSDFKATVGRLLKLFFRFCSALIKCRKEKVQIVILHHFYSSIVDLVFVSLSKLMGFHVCIIQHDIESLIRHGNHNWLKWCIRFSDFVIVHNAISADELKVKITPENKEKISVVQHGNFIGAAGFMSRDEALKQLNLDNTRKYLLFFGMLKEAKGLDILLRAMKHVDKNVHLVIAGRERDRSFSEYRKMISEFGLEARVHTLIRYISNRERDILFNATDCIVLPYRKIYQSGVLLMAMSMKLPVIAAGLASIAAMIKDGESGVLFEPGNSEQLADKINLLVADEEKRKLISQRAWEYVKENHDWQKSAEGFLNAFNS